VAEVELDIIAYQYQWHLYRMQRRKVESPGGLLATAIAENRRPPRGHPDERWFREEHPYAYLGEVSRGYAPKARGGGRKARRTANKGSKTAAAIVAGGLHFGDKHGALKKEKRQHRSKQGLKGESDRK
jgi:hypothetical protein